MRLVAISMRRTLRMRSAGRAALRGLAEAGAWVAAAWAAFPSDLLRREKRPNIGLPRGLKEPECDRAAGRSARRSRSPRPRPHRSARCGGAARRAPAL